MGLAQHPILYSFRRCPYAMRARMALRYAGVEFEHREVLLKEKPAALLAASPKGTVPVLVLPDQQVLQESLDIMAWALARRDQAGWLLIEPEQQHVLVNKMDEQFKPSLDRYKYHNHKEAAQWRSSRDACLALLAELEQRLLGVQGQGQDQDQDQEQWGLFGPKLSFADVAVLPFIRQFANVDNGWFSQQPLPRLQHWLARLLRSDLFLSVMQKYVRWEAGAAPVIVSR